jgi:hypothetical protein
VTAARTLATDRPFVVMCLRSDGTEREFCRYRDSREAERVAAHLTRVGCLSRVIDVHTRPTVKIEQLSAPAKAAEQ